MLLNFSEDDITNKVTNAFEKLKVTLMLLQITEEETGASGVRETVVIFIIVIIIHRM